MLIDNKMAKNTLENTLNDEIGKQNAKCIMYR